MTCDRFRATFDAATEDAAVLEHLRICDACLNFAVEKDGEILFRAIGGEVVPPGGVDAFVGDVMREVHLRATENTVDHRVLGWPRRLAVAATVAAVIAGGTFMVGNRTEPASPTVVVHNPALQSRNLIEKVARPVVESYDSQKATIVEVPSEGENVTVVMVFDDSLPADL